MDDADRRDSPATDGIAPDADAALRQRAEWRRLEEQLAWYSRRSGHCQRWHKGLRIVQVIFAASIPVISLADVPLARWLTASLGALIAVLEAVEQINQFGPLWIQYRSTAEHLKHEKYLFLAGAGPYRDIERAEALRLLAERVEEHVSREHARWVRTSEKGQTGQQGGKEQ
ncbi:hypothetical protein GCM10007160_16550 [Litchfieldella qijiaojingensis]|uniref:DUF4231 domain-containing protein n=1 Tax=Litchfieldella qijiaojingensis TaxID=980347 RepID=A0ABQ2YQA0_9GAMM|nr:DUF4231 domain-containing protein [Halomonas qijiaojingensis]GGX89839.1 hypothetical protein GCM10007160_16550 [Halomonas qijiaojingensis]